MILLFLDRQSLTTKKMDLTTQGHRFVQKILRSRHCEKPKDIKWAFMVGKAIVGGGIAVEKLCPEISDKGDSGDKERFETMYKKLVETGLTVPKRRMLRMRRNDWFVPNSTVSRRRSTYESLRTSS